VSYFEPLTEEVSGPLDMLLYKLTGGDLAMAAQIELLDRDRCFEWLHLQRVKELNEMRGRIEEWRRAKK
jgi:hypothetical protein